MTTTPPFRADEVGSLLRPAALKDARARFQAGDLDAEALDHLEDECIRTVVAKQEAAGLQAVTDGEFRRAWWHFDPPHPHGPYPRHNLDERIKMY